MRGIWNLNTRAPDSEHVTIAVSSAHGGKTVDIRRHSDCGITLLGMASGDESGTLQVAGDLKTRLDASNANMLRLFKASVEFVARMGIDLPEEPEA